MKTIEVRAGYTQQAVLDHQCDVVESFDFIGDAKARAKYYLTDDHQAVIESSRPLAYAQVVVDGEVRYDYFRKETKAPKVTATKRVRELLIDLDALFVEFNSVVGVMADRGTSNSLAMDAGIEKKRVEERILTCAWHISLAAKGKTPADI